jgi:hypothetical protein
VVSGVLVLDLLESSDGLSLDLASSVASPSAGGGAQSGVDLRVEMAEVVLGEDGDVGSLLDHGVALFSVSVTVGGNDGGHPEVDLLDVSGVLLAVHVEGGFSKSLEKM